MLAFIIILAVFYLAFHVHSIEKSQSSSSSAKKTESLYKENERRVNSHLDFVV